MWVPKGTRRDVDGRVTEEHYLFRWSDHVGEGKCGVREHAVAECRCCLYKIDMHGFASNAPFFLLNGRRDAKNILADD